MRHDDCEPDGRCLESLQAFVGLGFPDGFCTKLGCDVCSSDADCRKGDEICEFADGATLGQCVASRI